MAGILTAQYVRIDQTVGSVGDRIFAQLIDWLVMLVYSIMVGWTASQLKISSLWFALLVFVFPLLFYSLLCELFNHGQSLGKMAMKLQVVKADGSTPTLGAYLLRWLLYLIDGPMLSFVGLVPMILTRNNQRLGDLAAGTVVIKLHDYKKIQVSLDDYDYLQQGYTPRYPQAADLSLEQVEIIRRTIGSEGSDLAPQVSLLSQKVQQKMGISRAEPTDAAFLKRVLRDYQYYALEEI
ncbi:MAG: RDD family protein [Prevotella sp.]|nr:RDD family protein [Prevotella sp.]